MWTLVVHTQSTWSIIQIMNLAEQSPLNGPLPEFNHQSPNISEDFKFVSCSSILLVLTALSKNYASVQAGCNFLFWEFVKKVMYSISVLTADCQGSYIGGLTALELFRRCACWQIKIIYSDCNITAFTANKSQRSLHLKWSHIILHSFLYLHSLWPFKDPPCRWYFGIFTSPHFPEVLDFLISHRLRCKSSL